MNKFLILLLRDRLYLYEYIESEGYKLFHLNGEDEFKWDKGNYLQDFKKLKLEILDIYNLNDLSQVNIDIIYNKVEVMIVNKLIDVILPCIDFQVFNFKNILPELLVDFGQINRVKEFNVAFEGEVYSLIIKDDDIKIEEVNEEPNLIIGIKDIIKSMSNKYIPMIDLQETNEKLIKETNELKALINEKDKEIVKFKQIIKDSSVKNEIKEEKSIKSFIDETKSTINRTIIRAIITEKEGNKYTKTFTVKSSPNRYRVKWLFASGRVVNTGENIGVITEVDLYDNVINRKFFKNSTPGMLHIIRHHGEFVKENEIIAVISKSDDSIENIRKWLAGAK